MKFVIVQVEVFVTGYRQRVNVCTQGCATISDKSHGVSANPSN